MTRVEYQAKAAECLALSQTVLSPWLQSHYVRQASFYAGWAKRLEA